MNERPNDIPPPIPPTNDTYPLPTPNPHPIIELTTYPPNPKPTTQEQPMTIPQIQTQPTPLLRRTEKRCKDWRITKANRQEKTNSNPYNLIPAILPQPKNATKTKNSLPLRGRVRVGASPRPASAS